MQPFLALNGEDIDIDWKYAGLGPSQRLSLAGPSSTEYPVDVSVVGTLDVSPDWIPGPERLVLGLDVVLSGVEGATHFTAVMEASSEPTFIGLSFQRPNYYEVGDLLDYDGASSGSSTIGAPEHDAASQDWFDDDINLIEELESLTLLENQAQKINAQITAKQNAFACRLKHEQDQLCLKHLIKECNGVMCAAKAIWQRVCEKVGIQTDPSFALARLPQLKAQSLIAPDEKTSHTDGTINTASSGNGRIMLSSGNDAVNTFSGFEVPKQYNPLIKALSIIAGLLGLSALLTFIKRKCSSMRTRVERAADREERRNARAYRRAARRALMRKRWNAFLSTLNCFHPSPPPARIEDYEEKRALILQEAFLEQPLDQAEKGEVMEAEIRELRYAHEIISSLVHGDATSAPLPPIRSLQHPPPLQYPRPTARSRAESTYTLPSYTSEILPDYSSRPGNASSTRSVRSGGGGGRRCASPSSLRSEERRSVVSPASEASRTSRFTPASSVLEMSPRPSEETLRTRPSGDLQR